MVTSGRYFDLVREMKNPYNHRLRSVESVRQRRIKPTARLFATSTLTVRKWWRRYQQHGPSGLQEHSRAPHRHPLKTAAHLEQHVVALRKKLPTFGAARLRREFDLPLSAHGHAADLARTWLAEIAKEKISAQTGPRAQQGPLGAIQQISADTRIWTIFRTTGRRLSSSAYRPFSTPRAMCAAACCSGPSQKIAARQPAPFLLRVFKSIWIATESRCAI
jgi:transposase-like protein